MQKTKRRRKKALSTHYPSRDNPKLWREWSFKTIRMKSTKTTNIIGLKERTQKPENRRDIYYLYGDSLMKSKERKMSPVFAGTHVTQIFSHYLWDLTISRNKEWD